MDAFDGFPPGTVTAGKPDERTDGATAFHFEARPDGEHGRMTEIPLSEIPEYAVGDTVRDIAKPLFGEWWADEPVATPTVVETREGER